MQCGQGFALPFLPSQAAARWHFGHHCQFSCKEGEWEGGSPSLHPKPKFLQQRWGIPLKGKRWERCEWQLAWELTGCLDV